MDIKFQPTYFFFGVAKLFDFGNTLTSYPFEFEAIKSEQEAIYADLCKISNDLQYAVKKKQAD